MTLPHIDHLMYVDADVIFLSDVSDLWNEFKKMTPLQLAALAPEHELPGDGWYNIHSKIPYYGARGLNSGIILMNLTAMRGINFTNKLLQINKDYRENLSWVDQDMLNIFFKFNPSLLHEVGCEFNYRINHCVCDKFGTGSCGCTMAEEEGISIFHGSRGLFNREPFIANIYNTFKMVDITGSTSQVLDIMRTDYNNLDGSKNCANISAALFTKFEKYVQRF